MALEREDDFVVSGEALKLLACGQVFHVSGLVFFLHVLIRTLS